MKRKSRIVLGLNSGTSADGIDAVACEIVGRGLTMRVRVLGHFPSRYPTAIRKRLLTVMAPAATRTEELCRLNTEVGEAFARAAALAVKRLDLRRVDLIGSHGQTICHLPPRPRLPNDLPKAQAANAGRAGGTMQIGDPAIIAARLGVPVVAQFRQADLAVGGQGAPLVPWTDYVLFADAKRGRVIQNIGGIANLTWLPRGGAPDDVIAFDTGPGNMLIDALVRHFTNGRQHLDRHGRGAAAGASRWRILERMLKHPFLALPPPKSCGREEFGERWMQSLLKRYAGGRISVNDWLATATAFTAACITLACRLVLILAQTHRRTSPVDEIILCGGGASNPTLVGWLMDFVASDRRLGQVEFKTTADYGLPTQAKEGVSFAMLAAACVDGVPANLPRVTGARRRVVLGQVCNPEPRT